MSKKQKVLDFTAKEPLRDRQRRLWALAEAIEVTTARNAPLPSDLSTWLSRALRGVACGADANEVFNVLPEKRGVRKDLFLREVQGKVQTSYIAAATESTPDTPKLMTTTQAVKAISSAMPDSKESTVRKNYNKVTAVRKPSFTIGKK